MGKRRPSFVKSVNPYDLNAVSEADRVTRKRPLGNPRQENPYSLTRNRNQRGTPIPKNERVE